MAFHFQQKSIDLPANRRGAMLPMLAVVMVILFVAAALSIDIARIHVTRSELRTATDAAARAGVEALGRTQDQQSAIAAAKAIAKENLVANVGLDLDNENIIFGVATGNGDGSFRFEPGSGSLGQPINSMRVIGERTAASPNGPVGLLFGPLFGVTDFEPIQSAVAARTDRDIALVLDVSGSMNGAGRIEALRNALSIFLAELKDSPQDERVSLTVYSSTSRRVLGLTSDLDSIQTAFLRQKINGGTAIGLGLTDGLASILNDAGQRPFALKSIVIMTDGIHNTGLSPLIPAVACAASNIEVHTITFSQGASKGLMQQVAQIGGGIHLHADTNQQLVDQFKIIANQLRVLLIE